jgi:hypothetical protein
MKDVDKTGGKMTRSWCPFVMDVVRGHHVLACDQCSYRWAV